MYSITKKKKRHHPTKKQKWCPHFLDLNIYPLTEVDTVCKRLCSDVFCFKKKNYIKQLNGRCIFFLLVATILGDLPLGIEEFNYCETLLPQRNMTHSTEILTNGSHLQQNDFALNAFRFELLKSVSNRSDQTQLRYCNASSFELWKEAVNWAS